MNQNEKLLNNMKELDRQKLPKWFNGELYDEGAEVRNRFSGDSCQLNNVELSMYDFIMGATYTIEVTFNNDSNIEDPYITKLRKELIKGMDWFRDTNPKAYMKLLD